MSQSSQDPEHVDRDRYCSPTTTLENCHALQLYFEPFGEFSSRSVIVWRGSTSGLRAAQRGQRLRDLRPGDCVICHGRRERLVRVEIYR